jgi:hypothetical protein
MAFPNCASNSQVVALTLPHCSRFSARPNACQFDHLPLQQQGNKPRNKLHWGFSDMDWANERFNQITTDVQCADENSLIAAGSTEFQHQAQNLHGLLPQYYAGSEPGAVPAESSAYRYSTTILDDAHQSNKLLQARSRFGYLLNEAQSASTTVCTEPRYRSNQQTPPTVIDLPQSLAPLDHRLQSNVFSLEQPQFRLNDTFHNHLQSSAFLGLDDIFDDQQFSAPLENQPHIFNGQQSLHNQPQTNVFSLPQPQAGVDDSPHIFDDQQSFAPLDSQLQSGVLPVQSQSGLGNLPYIFNDQQSLHNQPHRSVFSLGQPQAGVDDFPHIINDQQSLHNQPHRSVFSLGQPQAGVDDFPHIFDDQQSLHNQPHRSVFSLPQPQAGADDIFNDQQSLHNQPHRSIFSLPQPQAGVDDFPHIFDDQQSFAPLDSQLQSGILPAQLQSGYFENLSHQQISAAFINSGSNTLSNPAHFPNEQSSSIVIPLTPASAEYHNTSTALVIQDPRKPSRQTSCIGCRVQKIKV